MKNKKNLFDNIRDNQHKLNERPSVQTWRKLERKLDRRKRNNNLFVVRALSMAAVMMILVGAIYVFTSSLQNKAQHEATAEMLLENINTSPFQMEELEYPEKAVKPYRVLVQYQEKMPVRGKNPKPIINEGKGKRLVVLNGKTVKELPKIEKKDTLRKDSVNI